jgi:hypothetical protein
MDISSWQNPYFIVLERRVHDEWRCILPLREDKFCSNGHVLASEHGIWDDQSQRDYGFSFCLVPDCKDSRV